MIRQPISWAAQVLLGVFSFFTLGLGYTILSQMVHAENPDNRTVPTWEQIYREGFLPVFLPETERLPYAEWDSSKGEIVWETREIVRPPLVWIDGRATLGRLIAALALATLIAVPLGLLMGCYPVFEAYFLPSLSFLAKIAPTAMLTVFIVSTTTIFQFYLAIILFGLIPILAQTIFHAAKEDVPEELLFKARTLGAGQVDCIWAVIFQYIMPKVMEAVRLQIGPAVVYLMAAEWARGDVGFGCRMRLLIKSLDMSIIFTYLILLGVVGLAVDRVLIWAQRKLFPWYATH